MPSETLITSIYGVVDEQQQNCGEQNNEKTIRNNNNYWLRAWIFAQLHATAATTRGGM
jgi:hypothetical protein